MGRQLPMFKLFAENRGQYTHNQHTHKKRL